MMRAGARLPRPRGILPGLVPALALLPACLCAVSHAETGDVRPGRIDTVVRKLQQEIEASQWRNGGWPGTLSSVFFANKRDEGLYPSAVQVSHYFLERSTDRAFFRRFRGLFEVSDNNMFATAIVTECLLESHRMGVISADPENLLRTVNALLKHRNRSRPLGVPEFGFYRQMKNRQDEWIQFPVNIAMIAYYLTPPMHRMYRFLKLFGIDMSTTEWKRAPDIREVLVRGELRNFFNRFNMPADTDDTGLALSVGALLLQEGGTFAEASRTWREQIHGYDALLGALSAYAYRPFGSDSTTNIIDPRTYHWLRPYLHANPGTDLSFVTTWLQHVYEGRRFGNRTSKIPMHMNNVDPTVTANLLLGLHRTLLADADFRETFRRSEFRNTYAHTVKLLGWLIRERIVDRHPDILLLYYPTKVHLYWSLARNLCLLEGAPEAVISSLPFLPQSRALLSETLRSSGTEDLLSGARWNSGADGVYWEGNFPHGDDRVYVTALTLNALMDIWTASSGAGSQTWLDSTPEAVVRAVEGGIAWLYGAIRSKKLPMDNTCFSGSVKGYHTLPFLFPTNTEEEYGTMQVLGIRGLIPEDEYQEQFEKRNRLFSGNLGERSRQFTYWTSPVLTKAVVLLAFSKYLCLTE